MDITAKQVWQTDEPPKKRVTPEGWWSMRDVSGSLAGVMRQVDANPDIPDHWKAAIKADLAARVVAPFNFVYLDAQCQVERGNIVIHYHATPDTKSL